MQVLCGVRICVKEIVCSQSQLQSRVTLELKSSLRNLGDPCETQIKESFTLVNGSSTQINEMKHSGQ